MKLSHNGCWIYAVQFWEAVERFWGGVLDFLLGSGVTTTCDLQAKIF